MQIHKPLRSSIEKFKTHVRSLRIWVLEVFAWWVLGFGTREERIGLRRDIRDARREVRELIFLSMVSRMTFRKRARKWMRPPSARSGFRYAQRRLNLIRLYTRGIRLKTLRDIRDALNDFERIVQRAIARVPKSISTGRLIITGSVGVLADVTPSTADADEGAHAPDTS
ncbi:MAG: hypothetical protein IV086_12510 [Hyphomonadaceae bacterium]|nr:hypothetical protein [Hyphomonadaceae bacterium]